MTFDELRELCEHSPARVLDVTPDDFGIPPLDTDPDLPELQRLHAIFADIQRCAREVVEVNRIKGVIAAALRMDGAKPSDPDAKTPQ